MRPFRFLAIADTAGSAGGPEVAAAARRAEELGYSALLIPDHLVGQHAPVPYLATVAAATERLRISAFVFNAALRHPAVLAQDLASLDVLSGGRLDVAVGAGWNRPEFDAIGLPFEPVRLRQARLAETVTVLKGCLSPGPFTHRGELFTITDFDGVPKPVQRPHPPFMIGGGGRRTLELAGREADIVGLAPRLLPGDQLQPAPDPESFTVEAAIEKVGWVRAAAGDRFDAIALNTYPSGGPVQITDDALPIARERAQRLGLTPEQVLDSPHVFVGSVDALTEKLQMLRERVGISAFTVDDIEAFAPVVERLS